MNTLHRDMCNALSETSLSMPDRMIAVDAILDRFEVTPKPPIYAKQLGMLVADSHSHGDPTFEEQGERMFRALARSGLVIVRDEE